jgi:hypothetical protein
MSPKCFRILSMIRSILISRRSSIPSWRWKEQATDGPGEGRGRGDLLLTKSVVDKRASSRSRTITCWRMIHRRTQVEPSWRADRGEGHYGIRPLPINAINPGIYYPPSYTGEARVPRHHLSRLKGSRIAYHWSPDCPCDLTRTHRLTGKARPRL